MEKKEPNILLQYGMISGLVGILLFVILYLGGVDLFTGPIAYMSYAVPILFAILACVKKKKLNGGFLNFGEALKISFGVLVMTSLATSIVSYVIFNFVDIPFAQSMQQVAMERTQKMMERFKAPQESIDKAINQMKDTNLFSLAKTFQGFMFACIFWFIVALIVSAIIKKKKPEFPQAAG